MLKPNDHVLDWVDDYLHELLEPADVAYVERHCEQCRICQVALEEAQKVAPQIRIRLLTFPEVKQVVSQLGRPEDGTDAKAVNNLEMFVDLYPQREWQRKGMTLDKLIERMSDSLRQIPGVQYNFSMPIKDNVEESISGIKGQIAVKLFGDDLKTLSHKADEVRRSMARVKK